MQISTSRSTAAPNATLQQRLLYSRQIYQTFAGYPETDHVFQIDAPAQSIAGMVLKPWDERKRSIFPIQEEVAAKLGQITGIRAPAFLPGALPSAGFFPVEFVIASTAPHEELIRYAQQISDEAMKSGQLAFPPIMDGYRRALEYNAQS